MIARGRRVSAEALGTKGERDARAPDSPSELRDAKPLLLPGASATTRRRIAREEVEARETARQVLERARAEAAAILAEARTEAARASAEAVTEAREEAQAELVARWLGLRAEEGKRLVESEKQVIAVAVALAERLLTASLELHPEAVVHLARGVIAEARGARRAIISANPLDADTLRKQLTTTGSTAGLARGPLASASLDVHAVEIQNDATLARGELRLHTDVGTIDARLSPRFDRLAAALRGALPSGP